MELCLHIDNKPLLRITALLKIVNRLWRLATKSFHDNRGSNRKINVRKAESAASDSLIKTERNKRERKPH